MTADLAAAMQSAASSAFRSEASDKAAALVLALTEATKEFGRSKASRLGELVLACGLSSLITVRAVVSPHSGLHAPLVTVQKEPHALSTIRPVRPVRVLGVASSCPGPLPGLSTVLRFFALVDALMVPAAVGYWITTGQARAARRGGAGDLDGLVGYQARLDGDFCVRRVPVVLSSPGQAVPDRALAQDGFRSAAVTRWRTGIGTSRPR